MNKDYNALVHAMQSGVAHDIGLHGIEKAGADPKHLRVGVNVAIVESSALWKMLVAKGIITEAEMIEALLEAHGDEVKAYETKLSKATGANIKLG